MTRMGAAGIALGCFLSIAFSGILVARYSVPTLNFGQPSSQILQSIASEIALFSIYGVLMASPILFGGIVIAMLGALAPSSWFGDAEPCAGPLGQKWQKLEPAQEKDIRRLEGLPYVTVVLAYTVLCMSAAVYLPLALLAIVVGLFAVTGTFIWTYREIASILKKANVTREEK